MTDEKCTWASMSEIFSISTYFQMTTNVTNAANESGNYRIHLELFYDQESKRVLYMKIYYT